MNQHGITYETVKQTFLAHHFSFPAGQVNVDDKTLNVQADFKLDSVGDVENIQILLTLVIVPTTYHVMKSIKGRIGKKRVDVGGERETA